MFQRALQLLLTVGCVLLLPGSGHSRIVLALAVTGASIPVFRYSSRFGRARAAVRGTDTPITTIWNLAALPLVGLEFLGRFGSPDPRAIVGLMAAWLVYLLTIVGLGRPGAPESSGPSRFRSAAQRLIVACFAITISLVALETVAGPFLPAFPYEIRPDPESPASNIFVPDSEVGHTLTPGFQGRYLHHEFRGERVRINLQGFRDRPWTDAPPPTSPILRLLALGDSFVFGTGVKADETFPRRLERSRALKGHIWTFNTGVPGYGPCDQAIVLGREYGRVEPDIVLLALYPGNDLEDCITTAQREECFARGVVAPEARRGVLPKACETAQHQARNRRIHIRDVLGRLMSVGYWEGSSRIAAMLGAWGRIWLQRAGWLEAEAVHNTFLIRSSAHRAHAAVERSLDLVSDAVERADEFCSARGVHFIVVIVPPLAFVDRQMFDTALREHGLRRSDFSPDVLHDALRVELQRRDIVVLDLLQPFRERFVSGASLYHSEGHWNAAGHAEAALQIEAFLGSKKWLPAATSR